MPRGGSHVLSVHRHLCKRAYPQCGDVVATCKILFVENDRLKTDVCFANNSMDTIDGHEVLRGPSVEINPILVRYSVNISMTLASQLHYGIFIGWCSYSL